MPRNFRAELISAVNSNPTLKSVHQRYKVITNQIILKMASSNYKYLSDDYLNEYLAVSKPLMTKFTITEKLILATMEIEDSQFPYILNECQDNINYILVVIMDRKLLN